MKRLRSILISSLLILGVLSLSGCDTDEPDATNLADIDVRILTPAPDDTVDGTTRVTFSWELSEEPNGQFGYFHQLSRSATFHEDSTRNAASNGFQGDLKLSHITTLQTSPSAPASEVWYWRIQMSADGYVSPWVERRFFAEGSLAAE
ncbi:MAG: hypothetical protein SH809_16340 [Rhodothermales bacterium]|nr:hypothetical protein [Rhodothermales bacterium]